MSVITLMKKIFLVLTILLLVGLLGLSACTSAPQSQDQTTTDNSVTTDNSATADNSGTNANSADTESSDEFEVDASTKELMEKKKPMHCTAKLESKDGEDYSSMTQEFYFDGNRVYSDVTMVSGDGESFETYTIDDGKYTYMWGGNMQGGIKMLTETDGGDAGYDDTEAEGSMGAEGPDFDSSLHYSCKAWTPKDSQFQPPSDVKFTDLSALGADFGSMMG